jgi:hypothetical protein
MATNAPWQQIEKELGTEEAEQNHPAYVELPASILTLKELVKPMITAHRFDENSVLATMVLAWVRKRLIERVVNNTELAQNVWGWKAAQAIKEATASGDDKTLRAIIDGFALAITEAVLDEFKV